MHRKIVRGRRSVVNSSTNTEPILNLHLNISNTPELPVIQRPNFNNLNNLNNSNITHSANIIENEINDAVHHFVNQMMIDVENSFINGADTTPLSPS